MYVGSSPHHASTVGLCLNLETGAITPQYHVVYDDEFATVSSTDEAADIISSPEWAKLFGDSAFQYVLEDDDTVITSNPQLDALLNHRDAVATAMNPSLTPLPSSPPASSLPDPPWPESVTDASTPSQPTVSPTHRTIPLRETLSLREPSSKQQLPPLREPTALREPQQREKPTSVTPPALSRRGSMVTDLEVAVHPPRLPLRVPSLDPSVSSHTTPSDEDPSSLRRSSRTRRPPVHTTASHLGGVGSNEASSTQAEQDALIRNRPSPIKAFHVEATCPTLDNSSDFAGLSPQLPLAFVAANNTDPDLFSWDQCMADAHKEEWIQAALKEIKALEEKGTWVEEDIDQAETKVLPGTWVGKIKRRPDGTIIKRKMRYCVRGDLDSREDLDTHSQVAAWSSIRIFLILTLTLSWYTCSCDFSNAFVQAMLKEPIWIHLPRGFSTGTKGPKKVLRLIKSLYGISKAPKLWQEFLAEALTGPELGFTRSPIDRCVFYKKDQMLVAFVDDILYSSRTKQQADEFFATLKKLQFDFTMEESVTSYLGIKFEENPDEGSFTLTQPGLIEKIITTTCMQDCKQNRTPAVKEALAKDPDGTRYSGPWNYRSVVGMLLYLSTNTRPDIAYAVSQVCRFTHDPKESHATAVKTIIRYLKGTQDMGTIVKPASTSDLEAYCDADFAGLYGREPDDDPTSAKSRMGYIIKLGGCPLVWKSQLISEITLSTTESEYASLSSCMRVLIPVRRLLAELLEGIGIPLPTPTTVSARVFEDNNSALQLAVNQRITNRTRHYLVKWHHFWSCVKPTEDGVLPEIKVLRVDTNLQDADFLTKGLVKDVFEANRKRVIGW